MSDPQLSDVLAFAGRDEIEGTLIALFQDPDFLLTDFNSGGVFRTFLELETEVINDLINQTLPLVLAQGFADTSDGDWLAAIAYGLFEVTKRLATVATQTITIACVATKGPYVITAGTSFFLATDGRRYVSATGGTLSPSGTLTLDVTGESPGAAQGLVNRIDQPAMPGVSLVSAAIKLVSGVPQYGSNDETDNALIARCLARWPSLTDVGTTDRVDTWAHAGSAEVTRLRFDPDTTGNPGGVIVTIAGASGAVSGGAVTAVQTYVDARLPITDYVTVQNATNLTITAAGNVTVATSLMAQVKAAADAAWITYLSRAQIGASVYLSQLLKVVMDAGAIDISAYHLNGLGVDVTLASTQVPVPDAAGLAALMTWIAI